MVVNDAAALVFVIVAPVIAVIAEIAYLHR